MKHQEMPRVLKTWEELEDIVLRHLQTRPDTAGIVSVSVRPDSEGHGGWTVKAFQEGTCSRGGCLQALHGILPVLQKQFALEAS
jgi:hypothetical protein